MQKKDILDAIERNKEFILEVNDQLWEFAEPGYREYRSAELLCDVLSKAGFFVEKGIAGMETAFSASCGNGAPVIALLGEYDAQHGMSQRAGETTKTPRESCANGHACGHHGIGAGALAAALALKEYMENRQLAGTIRYIGCPAAESGCGKGFLARAGSLSDIDAALTWHPFTSTGVMTFRVLATVSAHFHFHGRSAHASGSPHLGRSALDAVELMNTGVNFLREHVEQDVRMHYAITDAGGCSPNVVQAEASVLYQIRAPKLSQVRDIYDRIVDNANGAALMTGTRVDVAFEKACSNYRFNHVLGELIDRILRHKGAPEVDQSDLAFAEGIRSSLSANEKRLDGIIASSMFGASAVQALSAYSEASIIEAVYPYEPEGKTAMGSNDLGDISWNVPTVSFQVVAYAKDTPPHSWQQVAQGKAPLFHKAVLYAGEVMALAGAELLENPELVSQANLERTKLLGAETYVCPIPPAVNPPAREEALGI